MSLEKIKKVMDKLSKNGVKKINLSGGEPMLRPDIYKILDYARERFDSVTIQTNGITAGKLHEYRDISVTVSIEGRKRFHDSIRGEGSYEMATSTLEKLEKYPVPKFIRTTIFPDNDLYYVIALAEKYKANVMFVPLRPSGFGESRDLPSAERAAEAYKIASKSETASPCDCLVNDPQFFAANSELWEEYKGLFKERAKQWGQGICPAGSWRFAIDHKGNYYLCEYFMDGDPLGDFTKDPWYRIIEKLYKEKNELLDIDMNSRCRECGLSEVCEGGCLKFADYYDERGKFCPFRRLRQNGKENF